MNKFQQVAAIAVLLFTAIPAPAQAQRLLFNPGWGGHFHARFDRVMDSRKARIDHDIFILRADVSERLSAGVISPARASALTNRLNMVAALENRFVASGGLSTDEFALLETRLNSVRVAATQGLNYY